MGDMLFLIPVMHSDVVFVCVWVFVRFRARLKWVGDENILFFVCFVYFFLLLCLLNLSRDHPNRFRFSFFYVDLL